jgi:hypothetical protein
MTEAEVTAWMPIRKVRFDLNVPNDLYGCLEAFSAGLPFALTRLLPSLAEAESRVAQPSRKVARDLFLLNPDMLLNPNIHEFLKVQGSFHYDKELIQESIQAKDSNSSISDNTILSMASTELSSALEDALILAQLAYPIRISSQTGRTWVGRYPRNTISNISGFPSDPIYASEPQWPAIGIVPIEVVCDWESRLGLFQQGIARTPIQRALASFTHAATLSTIRSGELLFWAMQGLEAFYCRGNGDLRRQLSEKSKLLLGPWKDTKNIVGRLYDFRSKFVHGDFNLERWNNDFTPEPSDWKTLEAFDSALGLAVRMLLATLQKCAREKIVGVEFDYSLSVSKG